MSGLVWTEWLLGALWCLNVLALMVWVVAYAVRPLRAVRPDPLPRVEATAHEDSAASPEHATVPSDAEARLAANVARPEHATGPNDAEARLAANIRRWRARHGTAGSADGDVRHAPERREDRHERAAG